MRIFSARPSVRLVALFAALSLIAVACGSGGDDAQSGVASGSDGDGAVTADANDPLAGPTIDVDSPVDPEIVRQLAASLLQTDVEAERLQCLVEDADGDTQLTALYNGFGTNQITPEGFTALTGSVFGCFETQTLATSIVPLTGVTNVEDITNFTTCVADQINAEPSGDLAYTGLAAILVGFAVPEGAQPVTLEAATTCVPQQAIVDQMSAGREQSSGFTEEVDRDCVNDAVDESMIQAFWQGLIDGSGTEGTIDVALEPCVSAFSSDLPTEVPASFEPWTGEGVLAGIDPFSRSGAYNEAPPNQLVAGVDYQAVLTTADGEIVIDLFEDTAPITVNSFVSLARDGFYDLTRFHRVLDGFMAQGGDPTNTGSGGPGFSFDDEESALTPIDRRGLLAMANSGANTNGSQFFITFDQATHLTGLHAVFGEVLEGDDVLAQIELRDPNNPSSRGEELLSVEIVEN